MRTIAAVARALQGVLTEVAAAAAQATGGVQRVRKFRGATLVQTLGLGWLAQPEASVTELSQRGVRVGVVATPPALDQRFTPALAACLEQVLAAAVTAVVATEPSLRPLLSRFAGV